MAASHFDLKNTKNGDVKWTTDWIGPNRQRGVVAVDIIKTGTLVDGKTIHIHGVIRHSKQYIVIYGSGADSRFWGRCYHTEEDAKKYGW